MINQDSSHHPHASSLLGHLEALLNSVTSELTAPHSIVEYCAPLLSQMILDHPDDVKQLIKTLRWPSPQDEMYTRQRILEADNGEWSVYAICWLPGQYTPVHDHGTWGVVGVLQGRLHEHMMVLTHKDQAQERYYLEPAGVCLLAEGAVNTFVPEPDHIHKSGVPTSGQRTASLHLYGRLMTHYYSYDLESGIRSRLDVE